MKMTEKILSDLRVLQRVDKALDGISDLNMTEQLQLVSARLMLTKLSLSLNRKALPSVKSFISPELEHKEENDVH